MFNLENVCKLAKTASKSLLKVNKEDIDKALKLSAKYIRECKTEIQAQNNIDILNAKEKGQSEGYIDRLTLTDKVIEGIAVGIEQVAELNSPVGKSVYSYNNVEQDISVEKKLVPFGVIGIIFESRPNVTADAFALCFKTQNAVILKGGSDSINSNRIIVKTIRKALKEVNIDENAISLIDDTSRETTIAFMKMDSYVDLLIPRGSGRLINSVKENSSIPIIETGTGNCHIYVDKFADLEMSAKVIFNAKTQRYSTCNTCESLVVDSAVLEPALKLIAEKLKEKQVEIRADERAYTVINDYPYLKKATDEDFYTEYGAPIISVKTTDKFEEAIDFINDHSTKHSESIITCDMIRAEKFITEIDSACVYHNASTRFSDGFVFGLGAEIGIATQKLHARGPMGLEALVTTKYVVSGNGSVRK